MNAQPVTASEATSSFSTSIVETTTPDATALKPGIAPLRLHREPEILASLGNQYNALILSAESNVTGDGRPPSQDMGVSGQERRQILALSRMVCQATVEVLTGRRAARQLNTWLEPQLLEKIQLRAELIARNSRGQPGTGRPLQFLAERQLWVAPGAWESSIVFSDDIRVRACALRLQAHRRRWRVVAMEVG